LSYDVWKALWFIDPNTDEKSFGIGLGTIILAINVALLAGYTFGCHSFRHLVGGLLDEFSHSPIRKVCYDCVNFFNRKHMFWAWTSLFMVPLADLYIRLCSMGILSDLRII
jgi:hypothetical protein